MPRKMTDYLATGLAEGFEQPEGKTEADRREEIIAAWQHLVDTGLAWRLQGWFGRQATALIKAGTVQAKTMEVEIGL